ncbi:lipoprotein N-acylation protein LnsA [Staphylococcus warneri]|uniref:lipoprotein N-acylation protein LnsA n=1 Tax=Staphylococcus warneri TaxID=1292 RepID=UPI0034DB2CA5
MYKKFAYILLFTIIFNICLTLSPFHINIANAEDSSMSKSKQDFQLQPGDIIITKGPVLFGFFGHSSIAIDHDTVLQIEGPGDKPITESFESFKSRFVEGKDDWIKIYRCAKPGAGKKAARWTKENYENTNHRYLVTLNLKSKHFTYCTKIIYQAYKEGVSQNAVTDHGMYIISPYALKDNFTDEYHLKLVKTY